MEAGKAAARVCSGEFVSGWSNRHLEVALFVMAVVSPLPDARAQTVSRAKAPMPAADVLARSVALETQGDVIRARQVVVDAFGERPASYEPCVRLAALSLQMRRSAEAVLLYRIARGFRNSQLEAALGLGLVLTMHGYDQMARGAFGDARSDFVESLVIDDSNVEAGKGLLLLGGPRGTGVDAMASLLHEGAGGSRAQLYAVDVPVRVDEHLALRFAVRQLTGPSYIGARGAFVAQTHLFAGVVRDIGPATVGATAVILTGAGATNLGAAASGRVGGSVGAMGTLSAIGASGGTNLQAAPMLFVLPRPNLSLAAGVRITRDPLGSSTSLIASGGVRNQRVALDVAAHFGNARVAYRADNATLRPYLATSRRGAAVTLAVRVSRLIAGLAQLQAEQSQAIGQFRSYGLGFRVLNR